MCFDWARMAGKAFGGLNVGPSKMKVGGPRGAALPHVPNLTHFASLCFY